MSVITISRGTFSGGKILAECLADKLGYRCIDREVIVEKAAAHGVSQDELRGALEKPPSFLDRFRHRKYIYLALIQAALAEEVRTDKAVYHGNAGHLLLKGGIPVLRTRIIAPMDFRLKMAMDRLKLSRGEALAYIQKMDQDRKKWTQYLYGVDWGDPALYDIVINLEYVDVSEACDIIANITKDRCFEFTPECQSAMDDWALSSRVRANLAINPPTEDLEVEVTSHDGKVRVKGKLATADQIKEVERVVLKIPGVADLNLDELAPPTLTHA
jgi:cytidylate kinase